MRALQIPLVLQNVAGFSLVALTTLLAGSARSGIPAQPVPTSAAAPQAPATRPTEEHYWLRVTGDRVNLRSRADLNSRIVGRVERDDVLEAVGSEYGWHRVVPPAGVFSLVSAEYIERVGGDRGVVKVDTTLRVRVGSDVQPRDPMLSEVQTRVENGTEVRIIGALDADWLKIVPPDGVYVYVSDDYAEPISADAARELRAAKPPTGSQPAVAAASRPSSPPTAEVTTQPIGRPDLTGRWGKRLGWVLPAIENEEGKPLAEQTWDGILGHLRPIAAQRAEPQVAKLAAAWIEKIEQRKEEQSVARAARVIARRAEGEEARYAQELEEIRQRKGLLKTSPEFDARGVLRPSFVVKAGPYGMRYKLEDPFTHKVRAYVEFPTELNVDVVTCLGKYVGVRGEKQREEGVGASILRVAHITVLNPDEPQRPPTRETP